MKWLEANSGKPLELRTNETPVQSKDIAKSDASVQLGKHLLAEWDSIILVIASALTAILNLLGLIKHELWESIILILLTTVAIKAVKASFDNKRELSKATQHIDNQLQSQYSGIARDFRDLRFAIHNPMLHEAEVCDQKRFYEHLTRAIQECTRSVDLTQLDSEPPNDSGIAEKKRYFKLAAEMVVAKPDVQFRRIVAIPNPKKLLWVINLLYDVQHSPNYNMHYVDTSSTSFILLPLSVQIFDGRDVMIVDPTKGVLSITPIGDECLWIQGQEAPKVFTKYFQHFWNLTQDKAIKEGGIIHWNVVRNIADDLKHKYPNNRDLNECLSRIP